MPEHHQAQHARDEISNILILLETMRGESNERLARIEERQKGAQEAADHRHANMRMVMETFVPRRELDNNFEAIARERGAIVERVEKLESNQGWMVKTLLGAWAAGGGVAYMVLRGKGIAP